MENTQQGNLSKKLTSSTISKNENVQLPSISRWFKIKKPPGTLIPSGTHIHCIAVTLTVYAFDKLYCTTVTAV